MRNECPNLSVLQGPIYTHVKMRVYAGLANYVVYANMKSAFRQNGSSCMIAMKISLTTNHQYGRSGKMVYLLFNACYCSPKTELLETALPLLNHYSRFYCHADRSRELDHSS